MKFIVKYMALAAMASLVALMVLGGCMRQHVVSSPPAQRPARGVEPAPAPTPAPAETEATPEPVVEGTYVVDAPKAETPAVTVQEGDLSEERTTPTTTTAEPNAPAATAQTAATQPRAGADANYYVQVGAFSDLENANQALARLLSDGYKGSKLDATSDGLFRVQAGAFDDREAAEAALDRLRAQYPKGFVLKTD
jgi:cell division protein FtsN